MPAPGKPLRCLTNPWRRRERWFHHDLALSPNRGFLGAMPDGNVNLYLVGFMGTGKTTTGRAVAAKLGSQAMDSDHEIERLTGKSVAQVFAEDGEAAFRALERRFIESGHPSRGVVLACGGGLVVQPGMLALLQSKGVVICLHASLATILRRTAQNQTRPLLNVENPEERIRRLFAEREEIYKRAGTVILTDFRPQHEMVMHVARTYLREAGEWERKHGVASADRGRGDAGRSTARTGVPAPGGPRGA
jgi:shikimate kinase